MKILTERKWRELIGERAKKKKELTEEQARRLKFEETVRAYETIFGGFVQRLGELESEVNHWKYQLDCIAAKDCIIVSDPGMSRPILDNLHSRLAMLESQVHPTSILNKQYIMRMLGLNEEQITKKLLGSGGENGDDRSDSNKRE